MIERIRSKDKDNSGKWEIIETGKEKYYEEKQYIQESEWRWELFGREKFQLREGNYQNSKTPRSRTRGIVWEINRREKADSKSQSHSFGRNLPPGNEEIRG